MSTRNVDSRLMEEVLQDPYANWQKLVDRYSGVVFQVVNFCRERQERQLSPDEMEEIVVAVFSRLAENNFELLLGYDGQTRFTTYLTVLSRRIAVSEIDRLQRQNRLRGALSDSSKQRLMIPGPENHTSVL